ncbi:MAG: deoxyribonuclease IV [Clostridia bacterium]|nr:deoxyribonuclease IV [Clostridia bacterium]
MLKIGYHVSSSGGFVSMAKQALDAKGNTFAFFTRNPRGGAAKTIDEGDVAAFHKIAAENGFYKLVAHSPYTLNPCSHDEHLREYARDTFADDLLRMEYVPNNYYNFHPGAHTGQGVDVGIEQISDMLNSVLKEEQTTTVLLETMAGKGSEVGSRFEELRAIIDKVELSSHVGVCLDTCHVWDGGYDIVNDLDGVLTHFDSVIGLDRLKAIHLNDSLNPLGAHKDRHAKIGEGHIGFEAICRVINHPALKELPFILETPNDEAGYAREIAMLKAAYKE